MTLWCRRMKILSVAAVILTFGISGRVALAQPSATASRPPLLTIAEAVDQALVNNERVLAARDAVEDAAQGVRIARAAFEPQIEPTAFGWFGQSNLSNQSLGLRVSQRLTTGTVISGDAEASTQRNQLGTYALSDTTFMVSQPLLRGFGRGHTRRPLTTAEARVEDMRREQTLTEQELTLEVAVAYYSIGAGESIVEVARSSLERSHELESAAQAKLKAGMVSQLDVLRAQQLVTQAETGVLEAESAHEDARDRLRTLLRREPDYLFSVQPAAVVPAEVVAESDAIDVALQHRLDLQRAVEAVRESERSTKWASDQLRPQLDANLAVTRQGTGESLTSSFSNGEFQPAAFVSFSWSLTRTAQDAASRKAVLELERRRRDVDAVRARIVQDVRIALRRQERAARGVELARASEALARKESEVARFRYQRGLSNNLDLVSAETGLLAAESRRIAAVAELAVARLNLKAAMGTLDPRKDVGQQ